ncbi:MAG: HAD family hydrolase [Oscillospiraceae bacterium]
MIKHISDILVISDLDNTLLTAKDGIPDFNVEMIKKFQGLGGRFTVATGRSVESVSRYLDKINLNAPAITYNGGVIYDFEKNLCLSQKLLPKSAYAALKDIRKNFPNIGCEIMCDNFRIYLVKENDYTYWHLRDERLSYINTDVDSIKNNWIKVLFANDNSSLTTLKEYCDSLPYDDIEFVMTNDIYFEMMPKNITKGKALQKLCTLTGVDISNTIAVGDYYNDIEILSASGLSVCVSNAPKEIKKLCDITVPSCLEGGVGHLLAQIIKAYA